MQPQTAGRRLGVKSSIHALLCPSIDSKHTVPTTYLPKANQPLCKDGPVANIIQQEGSLRTPPGFNKDSAFVSMLSTKAWVGRVTHIVFSFV